MPVCLDAPSDAVEDGQDEDERRPAEARRQPFAGCSSHRSRDCLLSSRLSLLFANDELENNDSSFEKTRSPEKTLRSPMYD